MDLFKQLLDIPAVDIFLDFIDILVVCFVLYKILTLIKGTKAVQLLNGIFVIIIVKMLTIVLDLNTLGWLLDEVINFGFLAIIIIFQPEIRRALEQIGRGKIFTRTYSNQQQVQTRQVDAMKKAVSYMAKRRIGALISIEKETGLTEYIETGIKMNAEISSELLINIFIPNTPLHDGAVIMQKNKITAAACYLPLSESAFISKELGTRHRAALGLSEVTDAITVIVSEETGAISLAYDGKIDRNLSLDEFADKLQLLWFGAEHELTKSPKKINWGGKKNG